MINETPQLLIAMPGGSEWLLIGLVVLVLFGGKKIPELAKGLGKGMREFKNAKEGADEDARQNIEGNEGRNAEPAKLQQKEALKA